MDAMTDGSTQLPFGRRHIAFFDEGASDSYRKQARRIVKELITANEQGQAMQELRDLTPLFGAETCLASSLILECLTAVKKESLRGMGGAYDMLVTAGSLLLQEAVTPITAVKAVEKAVISNVNIKGAETILHLSEIREMCGSLRYKVRRRRGEEEENRSKEEEKRSKEEEKRSKEEEKRSKEEINLGH